MTWFNVAEAARYCGLAAMTVREYMRNGYIIAQKTDRGWRAKKEDLDKYKAWRASQPPGQKCYHKNNII